MPTGCRRFQCASYPRGSWSGSPSPGLVNTDGVPSEVHSCDSGSPTAAEKVLNHIVFIRKRVPIMHVVIRCKQIIIKKHLQILEGNVGIHLCSAMESIRGGEFGVLNAGELPDAAVIYIGAFHLNGRSPTMTRISFLKVCWISTPTNAPIESQTCMSK